MEYKLTKSEIINTEKKLFEMKNLYVIVTELNNVECIFTEYDNAAKYINRKAINDNIESYCNYVENIKETIRNGTDHEVIPLFIDYVDQYMSEYKIIPVSHLDHKSPIYVIQN